MILELPTSFADARKVIEKINLAGYEAYFVGGCVRDLILNNENNDIDIATSAFPQEVKTIFPRTVDVGIDHGTVAVLYNQQQFEITTFRTESTYTDYRRPDSVNFVRSLEEDLKRRDFTINALALSNNGMVIDHFNGLQDISNKIIRAVGEPSERFQEDALRIMRGFRFSSQLNFSIEQNTFEAIKSHVYLLEKISIERIHIEWIKLLLSKNRNSGLIAFLDSNAFHFCPCMENFNLIIKELLKINPLPFDTEQLAWIIIFKIGKYNSDEVSNFLVRWKCSNKIIKQVVSCLNLLDEVLVGGFTKWIVYFLGEENSYLVSKACFYFDGRNRDKDVEHLLKNIPIVSKRDLNISGIEILNLSQKNPGPWVGELLDLIESEVIEGHLVNTNDTLVNFALSYLKGD